MAVFIRTDKPVLLLTALLVLNGCQSQAVRPDTSNTPTDGNVVDLQQEARRAYSEGNWAAAEKAYAALTRELPRESESWFQLGNIYARQHRPQAAIVAYQEALAREPKYAKAWHNLGIVQLRQAANSFMYLESVTESGDPLHERARLLLETMTRLLESGFTDQEAAAAQESNASGSGSQ